MTGAAGLTLGGIAYAGAPINYRRIIGANDKIRVGIMGFSDRFKGALLPSFIGPCSRNNFEIVALSDIWSVRREEGKAYIQRKQVGMSQYVQTMMNCMTGKISMR